MQAPHCLPWLGRKDAMLQSLSVLYWWLWARTVVVTYARSLRKLFHKVWYDRGNTVKHTILYDSDCDCRCFLLGLKIFCLKSLSHWENDTCFVFSNNLQLKHYFTIVFRSLSNMPWLLLVSTVFHVKYPPKCSCVASVTGRPPEITTQTRFMLIERLYCCWLRLHLTILDPSVIPSI